MRRRRPYDPLEVVVIDLEVETATLVAFYQASREALALRTEGETRHVLDMGRALDRRRFSFVPVCLLAANKTYFS
jgi:hypothetical protein